MHVRNRNAFVTVMNCKYLAVIYLCLVASVKSQLLQHDVYDYCDPKLELCEVFTDHIMCKYPVPGLSSQCTPSIQEPLSATEKKRILFWHNKFRSNIANGTEKNKNRKFPTSSNMRQLYWDTELETLATRWAERCISTTSPMVYDKCRNTKRFQVSQNVGTRQVNATTIDKQAPQIVITWYRESKDFDPSLVDKFAPVGDNEVSIKQFANIIWADTYAIGCARVIFQEQNLKAPNSSVRTIERLVCNYGPGGNEIGKPIYKRGISCENCPPGTQCSRVFPGLCAIQSANKIDSQQNLETQEGKEDVKIEKEISTQEQESTSEIPVTNQPSEETTTEEEQEKKLSTIVPEEEEKTKEMEEENEGECEGEKCLGRTSSPTVDPRRRFDEIIKVARPTALKKSQEVGTAAPSQWDDISSEMRKRSVSKGKKITRRDKSEEKRLKNGDTCKCFEEVYEKQGDGASPTNRNIFLIFFSFTLYLL